MVHCDRGVSYSFAVLLVYMMTKRRTRLADSVAHLQKIRREFELSQPLAVGLEQMEADFDARKMKRLENRLRESPIMAIQF